MEIFQETKQNFYCDTCKYGSPSKSDFTKHLKSKKHEHGGLKEKVCQICQQECFNHWDLKQHHIIKHLTLKEKLQQKYYCSKCDVVYLSKLYLEKHNNSVKHNKVLLINTENQ